MARPRRLVALLASVIAATASIPAGASPGASRTLLNYGDSVALGTGLYLGGLLHGWSVSESVDVSRHTYEAPADLRAYGDALPRVVVISLGANDSPSARTSFERQVREVVRVAGSDRCIIWSTVLRPPHRGVSYDGLNAALRRLGRSFRTLYVFDWVAFARANPGWFGPDGVHPSMTGYRARAAAIARLARSCV